MLIKQSLNYLLLFRFFLLILRITTDVLKRYFLFILLRFNPGVNLLHGAMILFLIFQLITVFSIKVYMDYKKCIGLDVVIKAPRCSPFPIKGEIVAVYSNVLCVQDITLWGIHTKDITDFKIIQSGLFREKGGSTVTPPEGTMGNTSNGITKELVG